MSGIGRAATAAKHRWSDMKIRALMRVPGVMDQYDGFMHGFHGIPVDGCEDSTHSGRAYEAGFRQGQERKAQAQ